MPRSRILSTYIGSVCLFLAFGCAEESPWDRIPLQGSLTLDGQSVDGSIGLRPMEGNHGPATAVQVIGGEFKFKRSNGPVAGPHRVTLSPSSSPDTRITLRVELPDAEPFSAQFEFVSPKEEPALSAVVVPAAQDASAK